MPAWTPPPSGITAWSPNTRRGWGWRRCAPRPGWDPGEAVHAVLHGDPILRIVEQEGECDCDLVVVGKHGASLAEKRLLGSVTSHVLAESAGDVLVSV